MLRFRFSGLVFVFLGITSAATGDEKHPSPTSGQSSQSVNDTKSPADSVTKTPQPFKETAGYALQGCTLHPLGEFGVEPGLEIFETFDDTNAEYRRFPEELIRQLDVGDSESKSAALNYLAKLAFLIRYAAHYRNHDHGDGLFELALGRYRQPIQPLLEKALKLTNSEDRLNAAVALLALAPEHRAAIDAILKEVNSSDASRRQSAWEMIGRSASDQPEIAAALGPAIADKNESVRRAAVVSARQIAHRVPNVVSAIVKLLKDREPALRTPAAQFYAVVTPFEIGAIERPNGNATLLTLSELGSDAESAVPPLVDMLKTATGEERLDIIICLARLRPVARYALPELRAQMKAEAVDGRVQAATALLCIDATDPEATAAVIEEMRNKNETTELEKWGEGVIIERPEKWERKKKPIQSLAFGICAVLSPKAKALVPALVDGLGSTDTNTRIDAAWALRQMGPIAEPAIPAFVTMLNAERDDTNDFLTARIGAEALCSVGDAALPTIRKVFDGAIPENRRLFVAAMLSRCGAAAIPIMEAALRSPNEAVREGAAASLGWLGKKAAESREVLTRLRTQDTSMEVRAMAAWAMTQLEREPKRDRPH